MKSVELNLRVQQKEETKMRKQLEKICPVCGERFITTDKRRVYCSTECMHNHYANYNKEYNKEYYESVTKEKRHGNK